MNGKIVVNNLARFENYKTEVSNFLRMVGINGEMEIPHLRKSKNRRGYQEYYDDETKGIVEKRFKEDINLFGYVF